MYIPMELFFPVGPSLTVRVRIIIISGESVCHRRFGVGRSSPAGGRSVVEDRYLYSKHRMYKLKTFILYFSSNINYKLILY